MAGILERSLGTVLNESNANKLPVAGQILAFGSLARGLLRRARVAVVSNVAVLPDTAKAVALERVFAIAGSVTGEFTVIRPGAAPATTQAAVTVDGNVVFQATDAVTEAEIWYWASELLPVTVDIVVVPGTGVGDLPGLDRGFTLLAAEALTGGVTGVATVVTRGSAPSSGEAALSLTGEAVQFLIADAVTSARITYLPAPGEGSAKKSTAAKTDDLVGL